MLGSGFIIKNLSICPAHHFVSDSETNRSVEMDDIFQREVWVELLRLFGTSRPLSSKQILFSTVFFFYLYSRFPMLLFVTTTTIAALAITILSQRLDCPICCENRCKILIVVNSCGHMCCRICLRRYLETASDELVARLRRARRFNVRCFGGCEHLLGGLSL